MLVFRYTVASVHFFLGRIQRRGECKILPTGSSAMEEQLIFPRSMLVIYSYIILTSYLVIVLTCCFVRSARSAATAEMSCHAVQSEPVEIEIKFSSTSTLTDQEKEMLKRHRFFSYIFLKVFEKCSIGYSKVGSGQLC